MRHKAPKKEARHRGLRVKGFESETKRIKAGKKGRKHPGRKRMRSK